MKMPWIILIMAAPVLGVSLYLPIGLNGATWKMRKRYEDVDAALFPHLDKDLEAFAALEASDPRIANIARYVRRASGYPVFAGTKVTYYGDAAAGIEAQKAKLARA